MVNGSSWEPLRPLKDYLDAPAKSGVYEIGFRKDGYMAKQATAFGLHAVGYPVNFYPMYVGKCMRSLRERLGQHFIGVNSLGRRRRGSKASQSIKEYYDELLPELKRQEARLPKAMRFPLDGLYFTCIPLEDAAQFESMIRMGHFEYPWNRRDEAEARDQAAGTESADFGYIYQQKAVRFIGG